MTKTVTVKLSRGTYTCPNTGLEKESALFLSRADRPGVVYPFPDSAHVEELVVAALRLNGLDTFTWLHGTEVFEESTAGTPYSFEVCGAAPSSGSVH